MKLKASIVLVLVLAVGCSGAAPSPSPAPDFTNRATNQISLTLTLDQPSRVTGVISEEGGVLATTASDGARYSLDVPAGALPDPTEVTLTPVASIAGLPVGAEALAAVHFSPEGLDFLQPATVTVELPIGVNPDEVTGFAFVGDGKQLYQYPVEVEGSLLKFTVTHFSGVGALEELAPLDGLDELDDLSKFLAVFAAGVQGTVLPTAAEVQAVQAIAT